MRANMYIPLDETELALQCGYALTAEYRQADVGPGTLVLRSMNTTTCDSRQISLLLDPLTPSGFWLEEWPQGDVLAICGAARIILIQVGSMDTLAVLPFEYEECETLEHPWFVAGEGALLVATESRVFRIDPRPALRWCWSVRVYSNEWFALVEPPSIEGSVVRIRLRSAARDVDVRVSLDDALTLG